MRPAATRLPTLLCLAALASPFAAMAQTGAAAGIYRCGNSYSDTPCSGGAVVAAADARSAEQRRQGQAVQRQEARLAEQLAQERRQRWREAGRQGAARIGPSEAERAQVQAQADAQAGQQRLADKKKRSKAGRRRA